MVWHPLSAGSIARSMWIRTVITVVLGLFLLFDAWAQTTIDVVRLKDGTIVKGGIIEQADGRYVRVQLSDGSVVMLQAVDVAEATKEQVEVADRSRKWRGKEAGVYARSGFVNHTAAGLGFGVGTSTFETTSSAGSSGSWEYTNDEKYVRLETMNGWRLARGLLTMGVGLGLEYYRHITGWLQMPVYADVRFLPLSGPVSPVAILQSGYSVGLTETAALEGRRNGPQLAVGSGVHWARTKRHAMNIGVFYDWHRSRVEGSPMPDPSYTETSSSGYLRLSGGVTF